MGVKTERILSNLGMVDKVIGRGVVLVLRGL